MSSSIKSARQSGSRAVLICWMIVLSMRLQEMKMAVSSAYFCRASAICGAVELVRSGRAGSSGRTKGTPGETRL